MATQKINFTFDGVKYKDIEAFKNVVNNNYSVSIVGTAQMIRQFLEQKYTLFTGRGVLWVKSRKFANGNAIDVYFNRIPDDTFLAIKKDLDIFEYYDGHNYKGSKMTSEEGMVIDAGTKYLGVNNYPPYGAKERDEPAPDWDEILSKVKKSTTPPSSGGRPSSGRRKTSYEWGDKIADCSGWELYKKPYNDTVVFNLVKKAETAPNKTSWNEIRGEIYINSGFKWYPRTQTFAKWGEIDDLDATQKSLCDTLSKYYDEVKTPSSQTATPTEPTPAPSSSSNDVETIQKKINALSLVFKYAKTDTEKKIAENKINALKIILKYKK